MNQTRGLVRAGSASGSDTQLWYSIDISLVHFIVLDYMEYIGLDTFAAAQLEWLKADLARASAPAARALRPWIVVCGHVPMYDSDGVNAGLVKDIEPLLMTHGVDFHFHGHDHWFESEWPMHAGAVTAKSFVNPRAPIHMLSGAGAAPAFGAEEHVGAAGPAAADRADPEWVRRQIYR